MPTHANSARYYHNRAGSEGRWYMVLGAQDLQKRGKVLLFSSADLHEWTSQGEIAGYGINGLDDAGYMWECPDLFALGDQHVLICCPQGVPVRKSAISTPTRQCG
jgi:beta-fructofuranosidase